MSLVINIPERDLNAVIKLGLQISDPSNQDQVREATMYLSNGKNYRACFSPSSAVRGYPHWDDNQLVLIADCSDLNIRFAIEHILSNGLEQEAFEELSSALDPDVNHVIQADRPVLEVGPVDLSIMNSLQKAMQLIWYVSKDEDKNREKLLRQTLKYCEAVFDSSRSNPSSPWSSG